MRGVRNKEVQLPIPALWAFTRSVPTQEGKTVISNVAVYSSLLGNSVHHCIHDYKY